MYETFEEWFDVFCDHLYSLGYNGNIFPDTFISDFEEGKEPSHTAKDFFEEVQR